MMNFGVFIRSSQLDVVIIDKCEELLRSFQSDTKIIYASRDEVHNGLKVFFNCDSDIPELLKKKFLSGGDDSSTIHSLTTALIVHQAFPSDEKEFKESIRNQIGNWSSVQVLDIQKVPLSKKYPDIGTGKWIIVLDIPEIDELDEFETMGLPNNMVLKFPTNDDCLRVKFHCRLCQKEGHAQIRCLGSVTKRSSFKEVDQKKIDSTTTEKDILEIIYDPDIIRQQEYVQSPPAISPVVTTTDPLPLAPIRERPSVQDTNPAPPKRPKLLPVVIPDGIRKIIYGMPAGVLNVRQLEAFFTHVKKKSRPYDFAKNYTSDVKGLHSQLKAISRVYYMSPVKGSSEDDQFIKMLGNVLKRGEGWVTAQAPH